MKYNVHADSSFILNKELDTFCKLPVYIRFTGDVTEKNAAHFCEELYAAEDVARSTKQKVLPIVIDSFGGDVYAMLSMIDAINSIKNNIKIATIVEGKAMSAGSVLFSCGDEGYRSIAPSATIMIHDVSSWNHGKIEELKSYSIHADKLNEKVFKMMAKNCKKSENYFLDLIHEKKHADWYLDADEAKAHNLANNIGIPEFKIQLTLEQEYIVK